jgi:hypothetical protein
MAEARETRVFFKTVSDFGPLLRDQKKAVAGFAKMQAAETAYNASSAKERSAATKASVARAKALVSENASLKLVLGNLLKYRERQKSVTTAVVAANTAIKAQNNALLTNTKRLIAAAEAAKEYAEAQRKIRRATGMSSDAIRAQKEFAKAQRESTKAIKQTTEAVDDSAEVLDDHTKANVKFVESVGQVDQATGEVTESMEELSTATKKVTGEVEDSAERLTAARRRELDALGAVRVAELNLANMRAKYGDGTIQVVRAEERLAAAYRRLHAAQELVAGDGRDLPPILRRVEYASNRLWRSMERFGNWRPRLVPPFVALIPIIGAVIAALNPLVALLGSLGGVVIGLAGQIGSLAGAFVALPGILAAVAAGIGGVIASMGGVGNVFKTYSAMQKAVGKSSGGGGETQAERAERLADAERNLAKAQRQVQKAQENLNEAREQALEDLIELREEVSRASLNEERAIANLRLAQEAYWDVMAEPGSTMGDKLDAAAKIKEAEQDLEDVRKQNQENQEALTEAERRGVEQSERVIDAKEALTDAIEAESDAQRNLKKETTGTTTAAATAIDEYNKALSELSPSARKFVLAILAMQDQWKAFRRDLQEAFFGEFVDQLDRLPSLLRTLGTFLRPAVVSMGQFVDKLMVMLDSPLWRNDLATIGESNGKIITNLADAFLSLSTFLKDVTIAAIPFTEWLTGGLAEGADNMSKLLDTESERGSFREWLEKVEYRLSRWWQVVKNIGKTIFGFSAAASDFGDWLTDGLLEMTGNWAKAAEEAQKPGSNFKDWLERTKPILEEVDRLLGSFFGWFAREAGEQGNIDSVVRILQILTDEVGPALGRLMDTLAETNIDEKFLSALASIIESLDTIMENGGSAAFSTFFDVVGGFFKLLSDAIAAIPKPILDGLLSLFGLLAGITFVGKFTGLTNLVGLLLGFSAAKFSLWGGLIGGFRDLDKLKFTKLLGKAGLLAGLAGLLMGTMGGLDEGVQGEEATMSGVGGALGGAAVGGAPGAAIGFLGGLGISMFTDLFDDKNGAWNKGWDQLFKPGDYSGDIVGPVKKWITDINAEVSNFREGWNTFWSVDFIAPFKNGWSQLTNFFGSSVPRFFSDVFARFNNGWTQITTWMDVNVWSRFRNGWTQITTFFSVDVPRFFTDIGAKFNNGWTQIVSGLTSIWSGIKNAFREPVNWVITNIWNGKIVPFWNGLADRLGLGRLSNIDGIPAAQQSASGGGKPALKYAQGGVLPGYTPGRDVHRFYSNTGGTLDLSGGEAIMRPEFTRMMGGKAGIDAINKRVRSGKSAFALGGVVGDWNRAPVRTSGATGSADNDLLGSIGRALSRLVTDPVGYVADGLKAAVSPLLAGMSDNGWSGMMKAVPGKLIDGLVNTVKTWASNRPAEGPSGGPSNAMGWRAQWNAVKQAFPWANLNSAYRPGARTVNGGLSYHGMGRAIDTNASMEIFNWIKKNYPNSRELIYSPAGGRQLLNGREHFWGGAVRSQHFNHVHWAMKNGGVFDQGGWLKPGQAAFNFSQKPEAVLTNDESRALKALLGGAGLTNASYAFGATPARAMSGAPSIIDNSINIENLTLQNPVPEKPSVSLPKAIRQIGYMNLARTGQDPASS